jgi:hydrogenase maturation factor
VFDLAPLAAIASGALLLTAQPDQAREIQHALQKEGIPCFEIGFVEPGSAQVWMKVNGNLELLPYPERDEIARLFETI